MDIIRIRTIFAPAADLVRVRTTCSPQQVACHLFKFLAGGMMRRVLWCPALCGSMPIPTASPPVCYSWLLIQGNHGKHIVPTKAFDAVGVFVVGDKANGLSCVGEVITVEL
jgi:hypothetical protein